MSSKPRILRFNTRRIQGDYFHLTSVAWSRNNLPPYHGHDYPEIFWITEGKCIHRINGHRQILSPGSLVLMRATDFHCLTQMPRQRFAFTNLAVEPNFWQSLYDRFSQWLSPLYYACDDFPWHKQLATRELDALMEDARQLAGQPHTPFHLERFLLNTWHRCMEAGDDASDARDIPDWLHEAGVQIQELDVCRNGVPAFVDLCGRSPEHVSRMCRKHFNQTPSELVNVARLRSAAQLLRTTTRSVTEIALDCGFQTPSQFYVIFKNAYHTTPRRYRYPHQ